MVSMLLGPDFTFTRGWTKDAVGRKLINRIPLIRQAGEEMWDGNMQGSS